MNESPKTNDETEERAYAAEAALTRLKERYKLAGIVIGTSLVSIFGSWLVFTEQTQRNIQSHDSGHRDFVAQFVDHAIDGDIELRQRLARYFATVTLDAEQRQLWANYAKYIDDLIVTNTNKIADLQQNKDDAQGLQEQLRLQRELDLLEKQLGASRADRLLQEAEQCNRTNADFPARWLCIAHGEIGVSEDPGAGSNPRILDYARFADLDPTYDSDEVPWSGLFAAWVLAQSGVPKSDLPSTIHRARAWEKFGREIDEPVPGSLVVFWRKSRASGLGHIGFYVAEDDTTIHVISGNSSDSVRISRYKRERVVGFRSYGR